MKKGFTTVELVVSFSLISVMLIILFQLVITIRNIYFEAGIKTELLSKQALFVSKINKDLVQKGVLDLSSCGTDCVEIIFKDGVKKRIVVDTINNVLRYDNFASELAADSYFGVPNIVFEVTYESYDEYDSYFHIQVPVINDLYDEDFGLDILYQFNSSENISVVNFR